MAFCPSCVCFQPYKKRSLLLLPNNVSVLDKAIATIHNPKVFSHGWLWFGSCQLGFLVRFVDSITCYRRSPVWSGFCLVYNSCGLFDQIIRLTYDNACAWDGMSEKSNSLVKAVYARECHYWLWLVAHTPRMGGNRALVEKVKGAPWQEILCIVAK